MKAEDFIVQALHPSTEEEDAMSCRNVAMLAVTISMVALPCMAGDTGPLNIVNRCGDTILIEQYNARCSPNNIAPPGETNTQLLMFFDYNGQTIYCTYGMRMQKTGVFLAGASFDRNTINIKKICRGTVTSCDCIDGQ